MSTMSLKGKWELSAQEDLISIPQEVQTANLKIQLPGDIHSSLLKQKVIPDPYFGTNEIDIQWVGKTQWTCERTVKIPKSFLKQQQFIVLDQADTFVSVFINNTKVGSCSNQFRLWRFNITGYLQEGINTIKLVFEPSEKYAIEAAKKLNYPIPCSEYDITSPHRNLVRKTQCHSGWDWGPCIMAFGVYGSIFLEQTKTGFVDYIQTKTTQSGKEWTVEVTTIITAITDCLVPVSIKISGNDIEPSITGTPQKLKTGENIVKHTLTVINPELWYPAGCRPEDDESILKTGLPTFNENKLYDLTVNVGEISKSQKLAFRTLQVVSNKDQYGKSLYFSVNGRPIFSKGSNWIPADALPARQTPEKYEFLLDSLVKANQNTIRVWGGGKYESDLFYELCDKKGILVWQDCMFACSLYPSNPDFLENARQEVRHQVRRLSHHASLAIWCGNNENLGAITWYPESRDNRDRYLIDYDRLNEGVVGDEIQKNDPDRTWWPSSPSAGPNEFSDNWHSDGKGDMHYWSVWHEKKPFEAYYDITPRFVSEFGYQSLPSYSEAKTFLREDQMNLTSPVMEFHQRSPGGNSIIFENFTRYFRVPTTFKNMLYLSLVQQAIAIKTAVTYWRSLRPICMGATIWQLNDVWPIASWSSIEYSGKWKPLHYAERNFFAPITISLYKKENVVYAYVLNDTQKEIDTKLTLSFIDFEGKKVSDDIVLTQTVTKDSSLKVFEKNIEEFTCKPNEYFIYATLSYGSETTEMTTATSTITEGTPTTSFIADKTSRTTDKTSATFDGVNSVTDTLFMTFPKKCHIQKPELTLTTNVSKNSKDNNCFEITISAKKPAFYVTLDAGEHSGIFSDNMFTVIPGKPKTVTFTQKATGSDSAKFKEISLEKFKRILSITSLRDSYE